MDALEAIMTRRSVRAFTAAPVTDEQLETLLRAAMAAPSAGNEQPWRIVVTRDRDMLARWSRATPFSRPLAGAAAGLAICGETVAQKHSGFWVDDCGAATQNLLLAAHALGLGAVWIGVHPSRLMVANVRRILKPPRSVTPFALVALGHPERQPEPVDRFRPDFVVTDGWDAKG
ncbi:MAG TPA: nitroreductase family protein [Coriobacteriia bacterium]